jgi:altronate dehydratase large subunit
MDTPGFDVESVSGLAAGGATIILFSTGKGSPTGSPVVPVNKIGTNSNVYERMAEHIVVNAGKIIEGVNTVEELGEEIYKKIIETANRWKTASERNNHQVLFHCIK